jgi:pimeloyl-ACP methyl ester carboxylesterase
MRDRLLKDIPVIEHQLDLAGVSTAVLAGGTGPDLVLLHGPGATGLHWMRVLPDLMTTNRVFVPDLPGQGSSQVIDGPLSEERVIDWLSALIDRTCASPPALAGYALGGAIAARFACEHGDRLSALVLVNTLGLAPFEPAPEFGAAVHAFLAEPTPLNHDKLWEQCALDLDRLREEMGALWEPFKAYNLDRSNDRGVQATLDTLLEQFGTPAIPSEQLARIDVPTTLIWGRQDTGIPVGVAERASVAYDWPLRVIEDCAGDPPLEQPEALVRALRGALANSAELAA